MGALTLYRLFSSLGAPQISVAEGHQEPSAAGIKVEIAIPID